jgi:hypothetical protein
MNDYGKLRRCTERNGRVLDFYLYFAVAVVTLHMLIRHERRTVIALPFLRLAKGVWAERYRRVVSATCLR